MIQTCSIVVGKDLLILVLYVDDLFITGVERLIEGCKKNLLQSSR